MFGGFGSLPRKPNVGAVPNALGPVDSANAPAAGAVGSTLGSVSQEAPPSPNAKKVASQLGVVASPPAVQPGQRSGYARWVGQFPAPPEKKNRPPLVNYAPGTLKLSIMIPTLTSRAAMLGQLMRKLEYQIKELGPVPEVEVLIFEDNKENRVGHKRNRLLMEARGDFVVFVDDDDELSDDYVFQIYTAILDHPKVDAIGLRGIITQNGQNPRQVIYSMHNKGLYEAEGIYFRPPCHLTPIRRTIAQRFRFPDVKNFGEDTDFSMAILNSNAVKSEFFIDKVLYHYRYSSTGTETAPRNPASAVQPPRQPTFAVVILSALADNLRQCLNSLIQHEPLLPRDRIIVVDDGARQECGSQFPGVTWLQGIKPFIFSRNANIGIRHANSDVLLLNDDAKLLTRYGVTSLSYASGSRPDVGLCSGAISGVVGNPNQTPWLVAAGMRYEPANLAFVAVYIPKRTFDRIGPLDERFNGYGFEDNDYCMRCKQAGMGMAIYDGCVFEHGTAGNSTFRVKPEFSQLMEHNRQLFRQKYPESGI